MGNATLYRFAQVYTMDPGVPDADAVILDGDRIVAVGAFSDLVASLEHSGDGDGSLVNPVTVDESLANRFALPGLIDQHLHPLLAATTLSTAVIATEDWNLPNGFYPAAVDEASYRDRLAQAEAALGDQDEWLLSWGYHQLWHGDLDRAVLDGISTSRPIGIWQRSCHEWYMNSAAMDVLGIDEAWLATKSGPEVAMVDLDRGHFWEGGFFNLVMRKVAPILVSPERMDSGLRQMVAYLHQNGVTAYNEPGIAWAIEPFELYQQILGHDDTPLWSTFMVDGRTQAALNMPLDEVIADAEAQIARAPHGKVMLFDRQVKLFADGAIISQLMKMKDPYLDAEGRPNPNHEGEWMMEPDIYSRYFDVYWDAGWQIHTHVNGDAGLEMVLDTMAAAMARTPRDDHRCVIVHFANSTEQQIERIADLGAIVSANPYYPCGFADRYGAFGLGPERADVMVRSRSVLDRKVSLSFHSDLPMGPAEPLKMAWFATDRITQSGRVAGPDQRIEVDEALRAVTIGAAHSWRQDHEIGSISPGKRANLTIIDRDPYEGIGLDEVEVVGTFSDGRWFPVPASSRAKNRWAESQHVLSVENVERAGLPGCDRAGGHSGCGCDAARALSRSLTEAS